MATGILKCPCSGTAPPSVKTATRNPEGDDFDIKPIGGEI